MPPRIPRTSERVKLEYRNTRDDYVAFYYATGHAASGEDAKEHYLYLMLWWILLGLGVYVGFVAEMLFASCLFVVGLCYSIYQNVPYSRYVYHSVWSAVA